MKEELEKRVQSIIGLYNFYKHNMSTPQRVGILTLWIEVSVNNEEYEVANALQIELNKILNGEEEYFIEPPLPILESTPQILQEDNVNYQESIKTLIEQKRKKLKFVNYWGHGVFHVIKFSFNDFSFIILNFGLEMK